jgi:hypothetical protein
MKANYMSLRIAKLINRIVYHEMGTAPEWIWLVVYQPRQINIQYGD